MRKLLFIFTLFICVLITSCGVLPQKNNFYANDSEIELGVVGEKQKSIRKTSFEAFGNPRYDNQIKVGVSEKPFTKSIYKQYKKSVEQRGNVKETISFNDSLNSKPIYITIQIENKVAIVDALNKFNTGVFNYLKKSPKATLVKSLSLIPTQNFSNLIKKSDAVYLRTDKQTKQRLFFYKEEKEIGSVTLSKQLIFGYGLSSFCWKVTSSRKIEIATILNEDQNCSNTTKRNPEELEKQLTKSSFKFYK